MDVNKRQQRYAKSIVDDNEREELKISTISKNVSCNYTEELLFLVKNIPSWEIYLNDDQTKLTKLFLNFKNVSDIAPLLQKPYGSVYSALFGSSANNEQGIYGRLKHVYVNINKMRENNSGSIGDGIVKRSEEIDKIKIDNQTKDYKKELLYFIEKIPTWREYLNEYQIKVVELYIEHKSCSKVDLIIGKNSTWGILYGKTKLNPKGIYKKLEKIYSNS